MGTPLGTFDVGKLVDTLIDGSNEGLTVVGLKVGFDEGM